MFFSFFHTAAALLLGSPPTCRPLPTAEVRLGHRLHPRGPQRVRGAGAGALERSDEQRVQHAGAAGSASRREGGL